MTHDPTGLTGLESLSGLGVVELALPDPEDVKKGEYAGVGGLGWGLGFGFGFGLVLGLGFPNWFE
eukprot:137433-Amorphochlora_amoeboformis.AAC.1